MWLSPVCRRAEASGSGHHQEQGVAGNRKVRPIRESPHAGGHAPSRLGSSHSSAPGGSGVLCVVRTMRRYKSSITTLLQFVLMAMISPDKGPWKNLVVFDPSSAASVFTSDHKGPQGRQTQATARRTGKRPPSSSNKPAQGRPWTQRGSEPAKRHGRGGRARGFRGRRDIWLLTCSRVLSRTFGF